ncbi:MAG: histidine kinase dimerization/phosphoacceptor domain -containing protein [Cyanobacteria bacterium J06639_18]
MLTLNYVPRKKIIIVSHNTPLIEVLKIVDCHTVKNANTDINNRFVDCICIVEESKLIGFFSSQDIIKIIAAERRWEKINAGEIMNVNVTNLTDNFDPKFAFSIMQKYGSNYLPVIDNYGNFLGIVTSDNIAKQFEAQLLAIDQNLQFKNQDSKTQAQNKNSCILKLATAQNVSNEEIRQQEIQVLERTQELEKKNKLLQRAMCDRIATEAQLLQTTSELQELFQAFPDVYLRIKTDGTILSCHARESCHLYLPPEYFLSHKIQEIFPEHVAFKFKEAICHIHKIQSPFIIEYSLDIAGDDKSFEARLLPSTQHHIIVIIRDISERKKAEEALQNAKDDLEIRVENRTKELKKTNELLFKEIIERERIEKELIYRVEFEKLITTISTNFINLAPNEIDAGIKEALQAICKFINIDCSCVCLFSNNKIKIDLAYEWYSEKQKKLILHQADINFIFSSYVIDKLSRFEIVHVYDIKNFIEFRNLNNEHLNLENIQSLIILPIICSGNLIGSLIFASISYMQNWTEESLILLRMLGEMLGNILSRKHVEEALIVSEERYARAINAGKVGIWELNLENNQIYIDPNLKKILGYQEYELSNYFNDWLNLIHPKDLKLVKLELDAYLRGTKSKYEVQHRMQHKNGSYLWFLARGNLIRDKQDKPCYIAGSNTDISINKQIEEKLKISLKEKDILLKEIHHRVKNNLQIISSLLRLQARKIQDTKISGIFRDSQNRVRAMAMIHEKLYQSTEFAKIKICDYINNLAKNLIISYRVSGLIKMKLEIEEIYLKIDTSIICGLIINELVSNSIKHAFTKYNGNSIKIIFAALGDDKYLLKVSDNGIGINQDYLHQKQTIGLQLVWNLVEQIEGSINCEVKSGTSFEIVFFEQS